MIAVIFEVWPAEGERQHYLDLAAALRADLERIDGFISVERFQSLTEPSKLLSLSFWRSTRRLCGPGATAHPTARPRPKAAPASSRITGSA